jgi:antitoxin VapB
MALNIKDPEADRLARNLAAITGETLTEAVVNALRERHARQQLRRPAPRTAVEILSDAQTRLSRIPVKDDRTADEILGYDAQGLAR